MAAGLVVRQRCNHATRDDVFQLLLLRLGTRSDQCLAHHQCAQQGLGHQATPQGFKHHADVKACAAKAAVFFLEQRANGAQFGKLGIQLGAVAFFAIGQLVAMLDAVLLRDKAVQGVRQHAAVFGMFEVHGLVPSLA